MKKVIQILLISFVLTSCSNDVKVVEGDLYFKLVDFGSFYSADKETINYFKKSADSIRSEKFPTKYDVEFLTFYDTLKKNDLLLSPWINLKTESDIIKIYMNEKDYKVLEKFERNKLVKENKKVRLIIQVKVLDSGIYYSKKISDIKIIDGQTYWRK